MTAKDEQSHAATPIQLSVGATSIIVPICLKALSRKAELNVDLTAQSAPGNEQDSSFEGPVGAKP